MSLRVLCGSGPYGQGTRQFSEFGTPENNVEILPGSATIIGVTSPQAQNSSPSKHHRHAVYASEATGLLLIAFLLLVLTLIRYWQYIHWSWR